jgi:hypothetical protein
VTVPSLVSSCARAATAKEAAFRIDYPLAPARATRVVGFDTHAVEVVRSAAGHEWSQAQFYSAADPGLELVTMAGEPSPLADVLDGVDSLVMVAATGEGAAAVATIGAACQVRGIMTAGLVLTPGRLTSDALMALRPSARVLLVPADEDDLLELLRAIRA